MATENLNDVKKSYIFVKDIADIEFRYTSDANDGSYIVSGSAAQEVLEVLKKAEQEEKTVYRIAPMQFFNPKSWVWIAGVLQDHYGGRSITSKNMPEREHFSDHKLWESPTHDEWGSQIFY